MAEFTPDEEDYLLDLFSRAHLRPRWKSCYEAAGRLCLTAGVVPPREGWTVEYGEGPSGEDA